jgi:putative sugar O-methyltransferase
MQKIKVAPQLGARLAEFIASEWYSKSNVHSKSEYWDYHADQMSACVDEDAVGVAGKSGFYVPASASGGARLLRKIGHAITNPQDSLGKVRSVLQAKFGVPRLVGYKDAFDATMASAPISEPILSPYRIDHRRLPGTKGVIASSGAVASHYASWSGYSASDSIYYHYYYQNLLRLFTTDSKVATVMEIGAGNGNFPSVFFHDWAPVRVILVDLPETLTVAIPFLANLFPQARMVLPHEIPSTGLDEGFDFAFLTVDQLHLVADSTVDLAVNCHSFQEMTREQIAIYFEFVQRTTRDGGFYFVANRVEKIPCGPDAYSVTQKDPPNRFGEYPWASKNEVLIYEISRLSRLAQLDDVYLRLDRVRK